MRTIKERKYAPNCPTCGSRREIIQYETYGCDQCGKEIGDEQEGVGENRLDVTVFQKDDGINSVCLYFCSWRCVFKALPKLKSDYFASLPMLHYDSNHAGCSAKAFFRELKKKVKK